MNACTGLECVTLHGVFTSDEHRGGRIRNLRSTRSRYSATFGERLQRTDLFPVRFTGAFIEVETIEFEDLILETTFGPCTNRTFV